MQADGRLVVLDANGQTMWPPAGVTVSGAPGSALRVGDDGAIRVVNSDGSIAWQKP
jgi:hypothetical protein